MIQSKSQIIRSKKISENCIFQNLLLVLNRQIFCYFLYSFNLFNITDESVDVISTEIREENPITTGETRVPLKDIGNYYLTQEKLISEQFMVI